MDLELLERIRRYETDPSDKAAGEALVAAHARTNFEFFEAKTPVSRRSDTRLISEERITGFVLHDTDQPEADWIEVTLSYSKGGPNYFHGGVDPRGYSIHVRVETRTYRPDGRVLATKFALFSGGVKHFVEAATRFSSKKLSTIEVDKDLVARMKQHVLNKIAEKINS